MRLQGENKIVCYIENLIQIRIHPHYLVVESLKNLDGDKIFVN